MKVRLETKQGEFVYETEIPPFNEAPDVVGWGDRVFVRLDDGYGIDHIVVYRECFAWAITSLNVGPRIGCTMD